MIDETMFINPDINNGYPYLKGVSNIDVPIVNNLPYYVMRIDAEYNDGYPFILKLLGIEWDESYSNIYLGDEKINEAYIGDYPISSMFCGDAVVFSK